MSSLTVLTGSESIYAYLYRTGKPIQDLDSTAENTIELHSSI